MVSKTEHERNAMSRYTEFRQDKEKVSLLIAENADHLADVMTTCKNLNQEIKSLIWKKIGE